MCPSWARRSKCLGTTLTVIGVAAPGFTGESVTEQTGLLDADDDAALVMPGRDWLHEDLSKSIEKVMWLHAFGRLKPGSDAVPRTDGD